MVITLNNLNIMGLLINGQVGWRTAGVVGAPAAASTLWTSVYGVWNADTLGTSLDSSIFRVYNGDNVNDTSGNAQNGTNVGGVTFTTGKVGNAFTFNGTDAYVSLPNDSFNNLTQDFSISFWVNYSSLVGEQSNFSNFAYNGTNYWGMAILASGNSFILYTFNGTPSVYSLGIWGGQAMNENVWYNYVITRKSNVGSKIYRNGTLLISDTNTVNPVYNSGNMQPSIGSLRHGSLNSNLVQHYMTNGTKIDALTTWSKELSADEILSLYNEGTGAEYPFSSQLLPSLNDATPNANHGTRPSSTLNGGALGPSFTAGKIGQAFTFDGVNDIVRLPNNSLDLTGDFSISMWANWSRNNTSQILMSNLSIGASVKGWMIEHAAGQLRFRGFNSSGTDAFIINHFYIPPLNTWIHYTFVHKNNSNKMYVDGVLQSPSSNAGSTHVAYETPNYPLIGANQYNATTYQEFFQGKLDAVSVWNRELTAADVTELYNSGTGKQYPN